MLYLMLAHADVELKQQTLLKVLFYFSFQFTAFDPFAFKLAM